MMILLIINGNLDLSPGVAGVMLKILAPIIVDVGARIWVALYASLPS